LTCPRGSRTRIGARRTIRLPAPAQGSGDDKTGGVDDDPTEHSGQDTPGGR
jgi:hypothetical protein